MVKNIIRSCRKFIRYVDGKKRIYCGLRKTLEDGTAIREYCQQCIAYNKGFEEGYKQNVNELRECCVITCGRKATKYINEGQYIIELCGPHSLYKKSKEIQK